MLFKNKKPQTTPVTGNVPIWQNITGEEDVEALEAQSHQTPCLLFKHSTRCGISRMVLVRLERGWNIPLAQLTTHYLDLLAHRDLSNLIAEAYGIQHQSPQVLLIYNGKAHYTASHNDIEAESIKAALSNLA